MRYLTNKHLSRRTLLRGAGVALALPILESMIPAMGRRAWAAGDAPRRVAFMYIPHGAVMNRWLPAGASSDLELGPTMQSLVPWRGRLNVVSGLKLPAAYVGEATAGANHTRASRCWLTCAPLETGASPTSADQVAAAHIGQETPLPSLELAIESGESIAYRTPTTPLPMETNPRVVFERLFGDGSTPEERAARQRQFASLLDAVAGEVAPLQRSLPAADRARLDRYLTDIRELERRLALAGDSTLAELEVPDKPNGIPADFEEHANLMFDLLTIAWQADLTRVATLLMARELSNRVYGRSGITEGFHNCSHHSEVPANIDRLARLNEYHARTTVASLLQKLGSTPDGDGTLLDHALVVYGSGMSNANQHDHHPLPMLVAGGAGGVRGGRHLAVPEDTAAANLLLGVLQKLDVPLESFADSTGAVEI
ncbi:MAG TPA: DUF1552 domain-containing protein [Gammaproteobacteria bacterium]|nr:DUF1552 domain-containing protein [Gammaproteobacteria bacterium]